MAEREPYDVVVVGASIAGCATAANLEGKNSPNNRFVYYALFENLPLVTGNQSQMWFLDRDIAYCSRTTTA